VVWAAWHEVNLLALVGYSRMPWNRRCNSLVAHGWREHAARAWVEASGMRAAALPSPTGGVPHALEVLAEALLRGDDVVIAVDGPSGPRHRVRAGALWLARRTGCPVIPVGIAASRSSRLRRWDRLVIPLPGGVTAFVLGDPIDIPADRATTGDVRRRLASQLVALSAQAQTLARRSAAS
jgi:lysophospholipid acyltransferase (LPLAT)-like uncharacterized protein